MSSQGEDVCTTITARKLLRQRIEAGGFILAPGVHDGFSARIALEVGFDVLYMASLLCFAIKTWTDEYRLGQESRHPFTDVLT